MAYSDDDIVVDFLRDWANVQRRVLVRFGYKPSTDDRKAGFQFFNMLKRHIEPRPRRVHEAKNLVCPAGLEDAFLAIKEKISLGVDLRPHLSRSLANLDFDDMLLNDWAVYHLHISTNIEDDGFVSRTGPVIFARFEREDAYLIAIHQHGKGAPNAWTNQSMLKTMRDNWPSVVAPYVMRNVLGLDSPLSDDGVRQFRKIGVQTVSEIDGVVLAPMGGGYSTAGLATDVVRQSNRYMTQVRDWEERVVSIKTTILAQALVGGFTIPRPMVLTLEFEPNGKAYVFAKQTNGRSLAFELGMFV